MNENDLRALFDAFSNHNMHNGGEGDYHDFLTNYMHAINQGGQEDVMRSIIDQINPERRQDMIDYGGGPNMERNQTIKESRGGLNNLLRR